MWKDGKRQFNPLKRKGRVALMLIKEKKKKMEKNIRK